jgi:methyl-accepting chemotaxis protein
VARKVAEVETSNSENFSLLARARESAHELQMLAGELGGAVGRFRIDGSSESPSASPRAARRA